MAQTPAPAVGHGHVVEQRVEQAKIAQCNFEFGQARRFKGRDRKFDDARLCFNRRGASIPFNARLVEFLR